MDLRPRGTGGLVRHIRDRSTPGEAGKGSLVVAALRGEQPRETSTSPRGMAAWKLSCDSHLILLLVGEQPRSALLRRQLGRCLRSVAVAPPYSPAGRSFRPD